MPTYLYTAADANGGTIKGQLTAPNDLELEERLGELDLIIINHRVKKESSLSFGGGKVSSKDLIMLLRVVLCRDR